MDLQRIIIELVNTMFLAGVSVVLGFPFPQNGYSG